MIRLAADTDETYRPYAKTNKQLTDEINNVVSILGNTDISGVADGTVTGAIDAFANTILGSFDYNAAQGKLYYEAALGSPYTFSLQNGVLIANRS